MIEVCLLVLSLAFQGAATPASDRLGEVYFLFVQGRSLAESGNLAGAVAKYQQALALAPGSAEIRAELAGVYAQQENLAEAEAETRRALVIEPNNRSAHRLLGLILASRIPRGDSAAARSLAETAILHLEGSSAAPVRDPVVMLTLGELYLRAAKVPQAIYALQQFLIDRPGYPQAVMLLAQAYRAAGQPEAAQALVAGAGDPADASVEAHARAAEALEASGEWVRAADAWSKVLEDAPRDVHARLRYAAALVNGGDIARGRGELLALTRDEPDEVGAWHLLAQLEIHATRFDAAEEAARQIETIAPADPRGPLTLSDIRARRGDYKGVVGLLERRVAAPVEADVTSGAFGEMAVRLGDAWAELGNVKRAIATLEGARRRAPDDIHVAFSLAASYERSDEFSKAERTFRDVIAAEPEHAAALNYLGYMLADRGRKLSEAVTLIERALALDEDNPSYLDSLGWAYVKQRRFADALAPLERAAKGASQSSVIQDHLGDAYVALARHADAAAAFDRALAGDMDGLEAERVTRKRDRARAASGKR